MAEPLTINFEARTNEDWNIGLQFKKPDGTPESFTGDEIEMHLRVRPDDATAFMVLSIENGRLYIPAGSPDVIAFNVDRTEARRVPPVLYVHDCRRRRAGDDLVIWQGTFDVLQGVTR